MLYIHFNNNIRHMHLDYLQVVPKNTQRIIFIRLVISKNIYKTLKIKIFIVIFKCAVR